MLGVYENRGRLIVGRPIVIQPMPNFRSMGDMRVHRSFSCATRTVSKRNCVPAHVHNPLPTVPHSDVLTSTLTLESSSCVISGMIAAVMATSLQAGSCKVPQKPAPAGGPKGLVSPKSHISLSSSFKRHLQSARRLMMFRNPFTQLCLD